jgi:hypothetical protein
VDDITVHSPTFNAHLNHLKTVIERLTKAAFTINAGKCSFGRPEISFLGHVISDRGVTPDPERSSARLSYPPPKNQKRLLQFLDVCNYHHRFIVNYANYVAPLLPFLKKASKWKWTSEMQKAFEILRAKFADSVAFSTNKR